MAVDKQLFSGEWIRKGKRIEKEIKVVVGVWEKYIRNGEKGSYKCSPKAISSKHFLKTNFLQSLHPYLKIKPFNVQYSY